ncbi:hypothetical protein MHYP_G00047440 [Metynnis hypsauchen]
MVAEFYNVPVLRSARKAEIRDVLLAKLRDDGRLPVPPDSWSPVRAQPAVLSGVEGAGVTIGETGVLSPAEASGQTPRTSPGIDPVNTPPGPTSLAELDLNMAIRLKELDLAIKQQERETQLLRVRALELEASRASSHRQPVTRSLEFDIRLRFLWEKVMHFASDVIPELPIGDPEIKVVHTLSTEAAEHLSLIDRLTNFSSWPRAIQAVARILRRINKDKSNSLTTVTERECTTCHNQGFSGTGKDGALKVGGRLHDSSLPDSFKHPAILPKNHPITKMIIFHYHERVHHQEMLTDMSTNAFINGLCSFIAIRGTVQQIKSDQGSNFVGAKNELKKAMNEIDTERLTVFLTQKECDFCMNAPHSSHAGEVCERQIRTIRAVLNNTLSLSSGKLDDSSLRTFLYEAMAIVNSRPLTVNNLSDPNSLEPLTPNHLLTLKCTTPLPPPGTFVKEDMYTRKRWRHVQYLAEQFWGRWRKEYLANIATRQRWHVTRRNLQIGDIVMVKDDNSPRNEWQLARILETTMAKDGLVRRVKIQLGDRKLSKNVGPPEPPLRQLPQI